MCYSSHTPVLQHPQVSTECLDILRRVLVADPSRRITMEEIKTHKWFTRGLPPGALEMNEFLLQGLSTMDDVSTYWQTEFSHPSVWAGSILIILLP